LGQEVLMLKEDLVRGKKKGIDEVKGVCIIGGLS
jgi:hypothetical protein